MPEIFSEGKIDFDKFQQLFSDNISTKPDRYHLNWAGKSQAYQQLQIPTQKTLTPCVEESVDFEQTQNIFIEGENLEVLKALQKSYFNSIKMIYIDPPYNTGNDFVYNDNFAQNQTDYQAQTGEIGEDGFLKKAFRKNAKENGHFHSNWLNMMLPRLHLARNLLKDDGVIFISIDDNEQAQLKLLCDEVFGEENFVAELIWDKQHSQQQGLFKTYHEYVLLYAKNINNHKNIKGGTGVIDAGAIKKISKSNPESEFTFPAGVKFEAKDGVELKGTFGDSEKVTVVKGCFRAINGRTLEEVTLSAGWTQKKQMTEFFAGNEVYDTKGQKVIEFYFSSTGKLKCRKERTSITPPTLLPKYGMSSLHTDNLKELMSATVFNNPKPLPMLSDFIRWFTGRADIILDFFSGSGSTAHAILETNLAEGKKNTFISVQLAESLNVDNEDQKEAVEFCLNLGVPATIAEITKERIRRAGSQILQKNEENRPLDVGFKVFKLTDSHFKQWQSPTAESLAEQLEMFIDNVKENTELQAMLYEILLRLGLKLTCNVRYENNIFWIEDEKSQHYAILLEHIDENLLNSVINVQPQKVVALDRLFAGNDALKKNAELQMKDANIAFFVI
ncbi:site-specific DNA-methyltransferase [Actinobacillus pleuropneumoniae]|uniref:site-specific DNA-methyltransferase n=1 Tax=Actinobacillus pleuropneumoniae TaxID=715 RepID=UPI001F344B53|nr:site-specific DNA-methyltransferase [Actinobacillus pleuropneumoniae]UKH26535.1 site-specific DNA-methyltransferase [Actinobacillus pleuropneumoniae]